MNPLEVLQQANELQKKIYYIGNLINLEKEYKDMLEILSERYKQHLVDV